MGAAPADGAVPAASARRGADAKNLDGYVFFVVDSQHPAYKLRRNVVDAQMYVAAFDLEDNPVREDDILHRGQAAFDAAINTVNVGKFNLGFGAIGLCEHAFHEAITHADGRVLFGTRVTEFAQVKAMVTESYGTRTGRHVRDERVGALPPFTRRRCRCDVHTFRRQTPRRNDAKAPKAPR